MSKLSELMITDVIMADIKNHPEYWYYSEHGKFWFRRNKNWTISSGWLRARVIDPFVGPKTFKLQKCIRFLCRREREMSKWRC